MKKAYVSEIQRFCVHDGPGIRTTVFFQGCPLRCRWCQNPETISAKPILLYNPELCTGCRSCLEVCPNHALTLGEDGLLVTDASRCDQCGACCDACYFLARKLSSQAMTVDQLFENIMRDEIVYKNSGGGVTISGGEPLVYPDFNWELLSRCVQAGITTAVETAGLVPQEVVERFVPVTDTFLFDMKLFHTERHREWTGVSNDLILQNLRRVTDLHDNVVIRVPLIPGVNDTPEEFGAMMDFVSSLRTVNGVHILPFHQFGAGKYSLAGIPYALADMEEDNEQGIERCKGIAEQHGLRVNLGGTGFLSDRKATNV